MCFPLSASEFHQRPSLCDAHPCRPRPPAGRPADVATVRSVGDADTHRVVEGPQRLTIHLACIVAPETAQAPYLVASREFLQELAPVGSVVTIRSQKKDCYGRTVAEMFRNGQSVNLAMVQSGQAFAYLKYLSDCDRGSYLTTEGQAN